MANVLFTRDTLTNIEDHSLNPITDGQLLFDTSGSGKMYMDVGTQRLEMGGAMTIDSKLNTTSTNPIQNKAVGGVMLSTLDEINATTSKGFITDALATRALAQKIGTTDISSIGDGTCTGAISALNASSERIYNIVFRTVTSVDGEEFVITSLALEAGYKYLLLASSTVSISSSSPMYLRLKVTSGEAVINSTIARTSGHSGGGCTNFAEVETNSGDCTVSVLGYGFDSTPHTQNALLLAIKLQAL